jgi:hypothetical protein
LYAYLRRAGECLGEFINRVSEFRQSRGLAKHKEVWFRGESKDYGDTILRPELYRPPNVDVSLKPIWKLLGSLWFDVDDDSRLVVG